MNDPRDKRSWSGITYYLGQSLQKNVGDVDFLGPVKLPYLLDKTLRAIQKFTRIVFRKEYYVKHSHLIAWYASRQLKKRMKGKSYDCIVAPVASTEFSFFKTNIPSFYVSDATFRLLSRDYKKDFDRVAAVSMWEGNLMEKRTLRQSSFVIMSSNWARNSVIEDYNIPAARVGIQPLAANMDAIPSADIIYKKLGNKKLTFLFLAVEWERKGGPIAFGVLEELHRQGVDAKLIVCGCVPPSQFQHPAMEVIPFLNKNIKADHDRFEELLTTSHFLLLPTRADCSLVVGSEASAYGMPTLTTDIGGVCDVIKNGENGYCLNFNSSPADYAALALEVYTDNERYMNLITTSRKRFEQHLNWDKWSESFLRFYNSVVPQS